MPNINFFKDKLKKGFGRVKLSLELGVWSLDGVNFGPRTFKLFSPQKAQKNTKVSCTVSPLRLRTPRLPTIFNHKRQKEYLIPYFHQSILV